MEHNRRDYILKMIVEDFIQTAEPVGSKTLLERHGLNCSSATIRNEMMSLEESGLIEKPHQSSGRVPSSLGYKYYLERLKKDSPHRLDESFKKEFSLMLEKKSRTIEEVMEESCQILSEMTNLATIVLGPRAHEDHLASIQVVALSDSALTAIIVTDQGYVENKTFILGPDLLSSDIDSAVQLINKRLIGSAISDLSAKLDGIKPLVKELLGEKSKMIIEAFTEAFVRFSRKKLEAIGTNRLLDSPNFGNDKGLLNVMKVLADPQALQQAIDKIEEDVQVGADLAIISRDVKINGHNSGRLAVVGPPRMDYKLVLASLEYIAKMIDDLYGEDT